MIDINLTYQMPDGTLIDLADIGRRVRELTPSINETVGKRLSVEINILERLPFLLESIEGVSFLEESLATLVQVQEDLKGRYIVEQFLLRDYVNKLILELKLTLQFCALNVEPGKLVEDLLSALNEVCTGLEKPNGITPEKREEVLVFLKPLKEYRQAEVNTTDYNLIENLLTVDQYIKELSRFVDYGIYYRGDLSVRIINEFISLDKYLENFKVLVERDINILRTCDTSVTVTGRKQLTSKIRLFSMRLRSAENILRHLESEHAGMIEDIEAVHIFEYYQDRLLLIIMYLNELIDQVQSWRGDALTPTYLSLDEFENSSKNHTLNIS